MSASTIDEAEVDAVLGHGRRVVGPDGQDGRPLHKFNPVRLAYIRDRGIARISAATQKQPTAAERPAHPRYRLRRRTFVRADGPAWARMWSAPMLPRRTSRSPRLHAARQRRRGRLPRRDRRRRWPKPARRFDVVLDDGGGGARRRCRTLHERLRRPWCAPGGLMFAATINRTHEGGGARDLRRRIRAALAAARHAQLGQVRHAGRTGDRDGAWGSAHHRRAWRDLQFACRPLGALG